MLITFVSAIPIKTYDRILISPVLSVIEVGTRSGSGAQDKRSSCKTYGAAGAPAATPQITHGLGTRFRRRRSAGLLDALAPGRETGPLRGTRAFLRGAVVESVRCTLGTIAASVAAQ